MIIDRSKTITQAIRELFGDGYTRVEIIAMGYNAGTVHWALRGRMAPLKSEPVPAPEKPFVPVLVIDIKYGAIKEDRRREVTPWLSQ